MELKAFIFKLFVLCLTISVMSCAKDGTSRAKGASKYPNRLIHEKSPYLLQHKNNPVGWFPWGEEAFKAAKKENKPIMLSIGYSTCHWCHVMEKESFEDETVAEKLNEHFISIKVDREERPDVDKVYMNAVTAMTGRGGWPLTVFLTPDLNPFFGGTYFPKTQFLQLLSKISQAWEQNPSKIKEASESLLTFLDQSKQLSKQTINLNEDIMKVAFSNIENGFDQTYGGFGRAPKFPPSMRLQVLLRFFHRTGHQPALDMVEKTLDEMARGGIYDHLGGGFHRYSTDQRWFMPHFEKMLYTNALLAWVYLETYQVTHKSAYAQIASDTLDYVLRDMTYASGGFYSAEDADSEGVEGKFYAWTEEELKSVLTKEEFELFQKVYGITQNGHTDFGANVLSLQANYGWDILSNPLIQSARKKLFSIREKRIHPLKDDKILTAWNGLMIASMAKAYRVLNDKRYLKAAQRAAKFIQKNLTKKKELLRRYRDKDARFSGVLDDYAYLVFGLLQLYEADFNPKWIAWARSLQAAQDKLFWNQEVSAYNYSLGKDLPLLKSTVDFQDGAKPNANAMSVLNLLKLYDLVFDKNYKEKAQALLLANAGQLQKIPHAFEQELIGLDYFLDRSKEIAVIGKEDHDQTRTMLSWLNKTFLPNTTLAMTDDGKNHPLTLLNQKKMIQGKTTVYVCENNVCFLPTNKLSKVKELVLNHKKYSFE